MKAAEALDVHTRLLAAMTGTFTATGRGRALVEPSELGSYVDFISSYQLPEISRRLKRQTDLGPMSEFVRELIKNGETFLVSPDVVDEIQPVADAIDEHTLVGDFRPPVPFGFAVLDKPLSFHDHRGMQAHVDMVTWGETIARDPQGRDMPTSLVTLWNDGNRETCEMVERLFLGEEFVHDYDMRREFHGFYPLNMIHLRGIDEAGPQSHPLSDATAKELDDVDLALMAERGLTPETARVLNLDRLVCALWELMNRIPEAELAETEPVERHARKRAQASPRSRPATVRAVRLHAPRRPADPDKPKGAGHALDHRVEVRGHWRNQACGPGRKERKRIWIEDHQRGPEDAPVQEKTPTVYVVK